MTIPYLEEYRQLYEGAHRKAALPLGAPALSMHLAFWKPLAVSDLASPPNVRSDPSHFSNSRRSLSELQRRRRELEIDKYLQRIYQNVRFWRRDICTDFSSDNELRFASGRPETWLVLFRRVFDVTNSLLSLADPGAEPLPFVQLRGRDVVRRTRMARTRNFSPSSQHQTINFSFKWHGIPARLRFELSTEYHTITSYLDLSKTLAVDCNSHECARLREAFSKLAHRLEIEDDARTSNNFDSRSFRNEHNADGAHRELYHDIWALFRSEILEPFVFEPATRATPTVVGRLFADFRGLLMTDLPDAAQGGAAKKTQRLFFRPPFSDDVKRGSWDTSEPPKDWALNAVKKYWTFLSCGDRVDLKNYEFTASKILRGNAVYVTALGAQPLEPPTANEPVLYFIKLWPNKKWQIGRLVDSINQLGTLRLAAIIEIDRLRRSGGWLRDIEKLIENTRDYIQEKSAAMSDDGVPRKPLRRKEDSPRTQAVNDVIKRVSENVSKMEGGLSRIFEIGSDHNLGHQSVEYRLERASYYVRQFTSGAEQLGTIRIEGFQPYSQFVLRRLGSSFAYVYMLNERLQSIHREIRFFVEYLAAESAVLQEIRTTETNNVIRDAQGVAEFALWLALAPYYIVSLINDLFKETWLEDGTAPNRVVSVIVIGLSWYWAKAAFDEYEVFDPLRERVGQWVRNYSLSEWASLLATGLTFLIPMVAVVFR